MAAGAPAPVPGGGEPSETAATLIQARVRGNAARVATGRLQQQPEEMQATLEMLDRMLHSVLQARPANVPRYAEPSTPVSPRTCSCSVPFRGLLVGRSAKR
jgi:hypothetical protein|eukprot:COSAG01_NODE_8572_length_2735_cov_54.668058_3_plen_101_part_00